MMTLFLLSLTGIPPTAGFFGKFYVILAAVNAGAANNWFNVLAVVTMLNAAIAAFYYLRVVVYMWMRDPQTEQPALPHGRLVWAGLSGRHRAHDHARPGARRAALDRGAGRGRGHPARIAG